ncbi:hypothetical protein WJX73_009646 [Symbiochloris irregularis]|uniref:Mitochondrial carrier protein n=1 Tax=Symbiochloris irregularis TaxID=706552 RepID=A0AAW1NXI1_9CHLO
MRETVLLQEQILQEAGEKAIRSSVTRLRHVQLHWSKEASVALNSAKHLFSGFVSALVSKTMVAPLERVKMDMVLRHRKGLVRTARTIVTEEGYTGLWRGNAANLLRIAPFKAVNFFCYDLYRKALIRSAPGQQETPHAKERLLSGALAGMTACITCFPLDLVRTRVLSSKEYSSALSALVTIASREGIGALYVGCLPAVLSMAPAGAVFYGSYDLLKHHHLSQVYKKMQSIPASSGAKSAASGLMQGRGIWRLRAAVNSIAREQGPLGFYAGLAPCLVQVLPSAALSYYFFEACKRALHVQE